MFGNVTFHPTLIQDYAIEVLATDLYNISQKLTYILPVQNPVYFTASVNPTNAVLNDGSIYINSCLFKNCIN